MSKVKGQRVETLDLRLLTSINVLDREHGVDIR